MSSDHEASRGPRGHRRLVVRIAMQQPFENSRRPSSRSSRKLACIKGCDGSAAGDKCQRGPTNGIIVISILQCFQRDMVPKRVSLILQGIKG
jgi:hypothetical protein